MKRVKLDLRLSCAPAAAWALVGPFDSIAKWHPHVSKCELSKDDKGHTLRTITFDNGQVVIDQETSRDEAKMTYTYVLVKSRLPIRSMNGTMAVLPETEGCSIISSAIVDVVAGAPEDQVLAIVSGILKDPEATLKEKLGGG